MKWIFSISSSSFLALRITRFAIWILAFEEYQNSKLEIQNPQIRHFVTRIFIKKRANIWKTELTSFWVIELFLLRLIFVLLAIDVRDASAAFVPPSFKCTVPGLCNKNIQDLLELMDAIFFIIMVKWVTVKV